ncbi:putative membrane protein [Palleronia aestuarii]|uniref:Putative membrane protein n=1 Tax=Palleronia aestuarii TaxID=568105 RepID=A0A2W7NP49_9RHOB|nr:heparan-alpha-glucosaminide N-acetyltransferase [Palleronia aestuarii]PZX18384.1 putative membrane protein [Palleronia aestuarii]
MTATTLSAAPPHRITWLDRARGVALLAMIVFHGSFDLSFLGFVDWPVGSGSGWRLFAISIAGTFLLLSGVSLQIAFGTSLRARPFLRRLGLLCLAAAAITLATWIAMPYPIRFGILHAIATFSVLAIPFLRAPSWVVAVAIVAVLVAAPLLTSPLFSHPALYPLGLDPAPPPSFDYEPIFPWFAAVLAGLLAGRFLPTGRRAMTTDPLAFLGRHSLAIYLLHQPVLMGTLLAIRMAATL